MDAYASPKCCTSAWGFQFGVLQPKHVNQYPTSWYSKFERLRRSKFRCQPQSAGIKSHLVKLSTTLINSIIQLIGIAQGLGHLHENNIVHGNLRGVRKLITVSFWSYRFSHFFQENIFIGDYGNVVLSDFGISNRVEPPEIGLGSSVASSLRWQAPECVLSTTGQDFAPQSDVWSFGCIAGEVRALPCLHDNI